MRRWTRSSPAESKPMKQALSPGVIAGVVVVVVAIAAFLLYKGTSGGPAVGTKDTMPEAMKKAYGGGGQPTPKNP